MSEQKELLLPYIYYLKQNTPVDTEEKKVEENNTYLIFEYRKSNLKL